MAMINSVIAGGLAGALRIGQSGVSRRSHCPQEPIRWGRTGRRCWRRRVGVAGLQRCLRRGARERVRQAEGPRGGPQCLVKRTQRQPPERADGGGRCVAGRKGLYTCRPHQARAVPLYLVT